MCQVPAVQAALYVPAIGVAAVDQVDDHYQGEGQVHGVLPTSGREEGGSLGLHSEGLTLQIGMDAGGSQDRTVCGTVREETQVERLVSRQTGRNAGG